MLLLPLVAGALVGPPELASDFLIDSARSGPPIVAPAEGLATASTVLLLEIGDLTGVARVGNLLSSVPVIKKKASSDE